MDEIEKFDIAVSTVEWAMKEGQILIKKYNKSSKKVKKSLKPKIQFILNKLNFERKELNKFYEKL